eukprot:scaffold482_cov266-Amphora_coffeaeformis.AAC.54
MTTTTADNVPTEQELRWATRLKQAARSDPELSADLDEMMSDWEFLQHAIVAKNNIRKALTRMRHLQAFKRRYGITRDGSVEEAARDFKAFFLAHPGLYMSMANNNIHHDDDDKEDGNNGNNDNNNDSFPSSASACPQIFCSTYDKFNATRMKSEEAFAVYMRAAFYALQASQHTLEAIRGGMVLLMDIQGALRYRSYQTESRARELYGRAYPIRIRHVVLLHASAAVRILCRYMIQPWLSPKVKQLWTVAADRTTYLQKAGWSPQVLPEEWGGVWAVSDLGDIILDRLRQRYQNVETFRL